MCAHGVKYNLCMQDNNNNQMYKFINGLISGQKKSNSHFDPCAWGLDDEESK